MTQLTSSHGLQRAFMRAAASRSTSICSPLGNVVDCLGFSLLRKEESKRKKKRKTYFWSEERKEIGRKKKKKKKKKKKWIESTEEEEEEEEIWLTSSSSSCRGAVCKLLELGGFGYGGKTPVLSSDQERHVFSLSTKQFDIWAKVGKLS